MPKWSQIEGALLMVHRELVKEWHCNQPPPGTQPIFESEVDECCLRLAKNLTLKNPFPVPPHLRPWILVRLSQAALWCNTLEKNGHTQPALLSGGLVAELLIAEWHRDLRALWLSTTEDSHSE